MIQNDARMELYGTKILLARRENGAIGAEMHLKW